MTSRIFIIGFLLLGSFVSSAQISKIGSGVFSSAAYGPTAIDTSADAYSRFAYTYPQASLDDLQHEDGITAISFFYRPFADLVGQTSVKIYLNNSSQADFGSGTLNWETQTAQMTLVYQGDLQSALIRDKEKVTFQFNKVSSYSFDTANSANHLQVCIEYLQDYAQYSKAIWYYETGFFVPAFVSNNESKYVIGNGTPDSICATSRVIKPTMHVHYPRDNEDLGIEEIYALGKIAVSNASTSEIRVLVANRGRNTIASDTLNLVVSGVNTFSTSIQVVNLAANEERWVSFVNYKPIEIGQETLTVTNTDDNANNSSYTLVREVTPLEASYSKLGQGNASDYQFSDTTVDFATRYYTPNFKQITGAKFKFNSSSVPYKVCIWAKDSFTDKPGDLIYLSPVNLTSIGVVSVDISQIFVKDTYYVGIRELSAVHTRLEYQKQAPIPLLEHFLSTPAGTSDWEQMEVNQGIVFDQSIDIVTAHNVAVTDVYLPGNRDTFYYSKTDSLAISAKIENLGFATINEVIFRCEVKDRFGNLLATSDDTVTVSVNADTTVQFAKFSRAYFGDHYITITATSSLEEVPYNNELERKFTLVVDKDASATTIFSPDYGDTFSINEFAFYPLVRVINLGRQSQIDIPIKMEVLRAGKVVYEETKYQSLLPQFSTIVSFDSFVPMVPGELVVRYITLLPDDVFPRNDTSATVIFVKVNYDLEVRQILSPAIEAKMDKAQLFVPQAEVSNNGLKNVSNAQVICQIKDLLGNLVYTDSKMVSLLSGQLTTLTFTAHSIDSLGDFTICVSTSFLADEFSLNDEKCQLLYITEPKNLKINSVVLPSDNSLVARSVDSLFPIIQLNNIGTDSIENAQVSITILNESQQQVYTDSLLVSLGVDLVQDVPFSKALDRSLAGVYTVRVVNHWALENTPSPNDTLMSSYTIVPSIDIAVSTILVPIDQDTVELGNEVNIKVRIQNLGIAVAEGVKLRVSISDANAVERFVDTLCYSGLQRLEYINLQSSQFWTSDDTGKYIIKCEVVSPDDEPSNDIISTVVCVVKYKDIALHEIVFPPNQLVLQTGQGYVPRINVKNEGLRKMEFVVVKCKISDDSLLFVRTEIIDILPFQSLQVSFDSVFFDRARDSVTAVFSVTYLEDIYNDNDTLSSTFSVQKVNSVSDKLASQIQVYPNPSLGNIHVQSGTVIRKVRIADVNGRSVYFGNPMASTFIVSIDEPTGVYLLQLVTDQGVVNRRLVLQRD
jgi:hypothetical protein